MSKRITSILLRDEDNRTVSSEVTDPDREDLTPQQIVDTLLELDGDDIDDIQKELNYRWGREGTHG